MMLMGTRGVKGCLMGVKEAGGAGGLGGGALSFERRTFDL